MKSLKGYLFIIGSSLFWGVSATVAKFLFSRNVDVVILTQTRLTIPFILMAAAFLLFRRDLLVINPRDLYKFALLGVIGEVGSMFTYYYTIEQTNVATAILLQYLAPLFVLGYAAVSGSERLTALKVMLGLLSFAGCALAIAGRDLSVVTLNRMGLLSGLCSACCWGFSNVWLRHVLKSYSIWTALVYSLFFASAFSMFLNPPWHIVAAGYSGPEWLIFFVFAVSSILIPEIFFFSGIKYLTASTAIITAAMEPVIAIVSAYIFLHEILAPVQIAGALLVILTVVVLQNRHDPVAELQL
jgi:drug/metabolite transporter (DMT)-like permease